MNQPRLIVIDNEPDLAGFVCDVAELADFGTGPFNLAVDDKIDCFSRIIFSRTNSGVLYSYYLSLVHWPEDGYCWFC